MRKAIDGTSDISCCDRVFGHFLSGRMTEDYVAAVLNSYRQGRFEIYLHPALHSETGGDLSPEISQEVREFRILTSGYITHSVKRLQGRVFRQSIQEFVQ